MRFYVEKLKTLGPQMVLTSDPMEPWGRTKFVGTEVKELLDVSMRFARRLRGMILAMLEEGGETGIDKLDVAHRTSVKLRSS